MSGDTIDPELAKKYVAYMRYLATRAHHSWFTEDEIERIENEWKEVAPDG